MRCRNERCITHGEGARYLVPDFQLRQEGPPVLACAFCGRELEAPLVGHATRHTFYRYNAAEARRIKPENRVYFESEAQALAAGYKPHA